MAAGSYNFSRRNKLSPGSASVYPALVYFRPAIATMSPADTSCTGTY